MKQRAIMWPAGGLTRAFIDNTIPDGQYVTETKYQDSIKGWMGRFKEYFGYDGVKDDISKITLSDDTFEELVDTANTFSKVIEVPV